MDRKIDNMKVSYDKMVGLLKEQLRLATSGQAQEESVELEDKETDVTADEEVQSTTEGNTTRSPLAAASPSSIQQRQSSEADLTKDLGRSTNTRKTQRVASSASEASESICMENENMLKSAGSVKRCVPPASIRQYLHDQLTRASYRQLHKSGNRAKNVLATLDDH